ncbi:MAG: helix-turn-helix transcriptional regulator [Firmicutes bacterium]|nr:helix-turn-helix transcriptional regulator [Bacillota bacterium]
MDIDYKSIGKRIKIARIKNDITQEKLAENIGISPSHLSNIETGTTRLSLQAIINLSNALDVSIDTLLSDNIIRSGAVFRDEIQEATDDCDDHEIRILAKIIIAAKEALRKESELKQVQQVAQE